MRLKIAICDDEITDLTYQKALIEKVLPEITDIEWEIDTFSSPEDMLSSNKNYNMVFLDVEMEGMDGIATAERLHSKSPLTLIFFATAHEDYMDDALDSHAFRFWTKPVNEERLAYGIEKAIDRINIYERNLEINVAGEIVKIPLTEISYICHNGRLTHIITKQGREETYNTFRSVTEQLTGECFAETHRSCYVNLNYVEDYDRLGIKCSYEDEQYKPYLSVRKYSEFNKKFREWSSNLK